ncbi:MAG: transglycosylase SLT domain-containing protein [Usitatibacter sp.]
MTHLRSILSTLLAAAWAWAAAPALAQAVSEPSSTAVAAAAIPRLPAAFEDPDDVPMPDPDLWHRIRVGFLMEPLDSPLVEEHEAWYSSRPEYIKRFVDRGSLYLHHIVEQVEKRKMPMEVALLPVIESAFTPKAMSRAKASGIWQFIPSTGKSYGLTQDWWRDNRNDVVAATDAALNYLQRLHGMFGDWELALAAYNCGEGCVGRAIAANQKRGLPTDFASLNLPPETRNYVPKLIAVKNIVLAPATYGIDIGSIPDSPYFATVEAPGRIDMKLAARLAEMGEKEFAALNPAHNKPVAVSSASGANKLVFPVEKVDVFKANLEAYDKPLVSWTTYPAKRGESLDAIAKRHGLTPAGLRAANDTAKLDKKGRLRAAGPVMVPLRPGGSAAPEVAAAHAKPATQSKPAAAAEASAAGTVRSYVVRAGDTLYGIARRFDMAVDKLLSLNKLSRTAVIQPGRKLRVQ